MKTIENGRAVEPVASAVIRKIPMSETPLRLPDSLNEWIGALLGQVSRKLRDNFDTRLLELGIRARHWVVLKVVDGEPLTQIEIGRMLGVDRTTMVALIDDLERAGYVARVVHPRDRRAYAVTLTDSGREALAKGTDAVRLTEEECLSALLPEERERLRGLLTRLLEPGEQTAAGSAAGAV